MSDGRRPSGRTGERWRWGRVGRTGRCDASPSGGAWLASGLRGMGRPLARLRGRPRPRPRSGGVAGSAAIVGVLGVVAALTAVMAGCAATPPLPPTIRVVGLVERAEAVALPADAILVVRLERGGTVLDRVELPVPAGDQPSQFELLVDRELAGGVATVRAEIRAGGRVVLATLAPPTVPLQAAPPPVALRLEVPRRSVGP